ncbi:MAG TPA: SDR family oxidoreductase [Bacteroidales bacterium]|nr:SDR family oxidoreductase [Bacteroidales bacterium]
MNIIINGGTRGIGRKIAEYLADDKDNSVIVTGRSTKALEELAENYKSIIPVSLDMSVFESDTSPLAGKVKEHFDEADILINMAGLLIRKPFMEFTAEESRLIMETNFFGPAAVIRALKPYMRRGSHIINISSMGGFQGASKYPGMSLYSASKAALANLTECLAEEFSDSGIKVNCLALGAVQTEMLSEAFPGYMAPVDAGSMAGFISYFAINGHKYFNGKILPVAVDNP